MVPWLALLGQLATDLARSCSGQEIHSSISESERIDATREHDVASALGSEGIAGARRHGPLDAGGSKSLETTLVDEALGPRGSGRVHATRRKESIFGRKKDGIAARGGEGIARSARGDCGL